MNTKNRNFNRVTVIGAGVSGMALALLAQDLGMEVFVSEKRDDLAENVLQRLKNKGIPWETGGHTSRVFEADALLLSSGISPETFCVREAERRGLPVVGELDFVLPHIKGRIIGVTGSNGKSTVTALCGHILKKTGLKTAVGGNIGEAVSLFTKEFFDCVVLELSSFQLYWAHSLKSAVGIVTNLAPDHIDWHGNYESYVAAKAKLLSLQDANGWSVIQDRDRDALRIARPEKAVLLSWEEKPFHRGTNEGGTNEGGANKGGANETAGQIFMKKDRAELYLAKQEHLLFRYEETALLGRHNLENVAMALTTAYLLDVSVTNVRETLSDFLSLPHRCELAGTINGVAYVDDSKGTNVAASVTALTSIEGRKIVILGGKGKGEDYDALAEATLREAEAAVLMGAESDRIEQALKSVGFASIYKVAGMEEAVLTARNLAHSGMVVLLSPACTSWDMYENYKKRGEHFCAVVQSLEK
ncbi:MAG: UDP-N-acetylmuramoyl-L-alanine--D-glutamate ligase [Synergistaceae bacterium]|jgi:UDP-N-acetylmuramoylalanine--D-glutamate ligase|nr:UDP-N-acetylmuramoyl-L-alanine--D-glutamate ligase [Synergistaceae bacterium]